MGTRFNRADNNCFCIHTDFQLHFLKNGAAYLSYECFTKKLILINMANAKNLARLSCKILYNQDKLKFIIKATCIQNELYPYILLKGQTS